MSSSALRAVALLACLLGLVAGPAASSGAVSGDTPAGDLSVRVTRAFSPNGDGRKDEATVSYDLPRAGRVTVVVLTGIPSTTVRMVRLGWQKAGEHSWRWDGRGKGGERQVDSTYYVRVKLEASSGSYENVYRAKTQIDTTLLAGVEPRTDYSLPEGRALPVYPRTTVVRDSVSLRPMFYERLRWARLVIMDAHGRAVLKKDVSDAKDFGYTNADYGKPHPDDVVWTARRGGKALHPGKYRAFLRARDSVGNTKRSAVYPLWVSREALEWREETRVVRAADTREGLCGFLDTSNGCYDVPANCGTVVPSAVLDGGLSHRSARCGDTASSRDRASSVHFLPVPDTAGVRGIGAARVAFAGRPTVDGEADQGTLAVWQEDFALPAATVSGSTGGATAWVDCPRSCRGVESYDEVFDPGVVWSFTTTGTDSVDVGTFTVDLRYLAVPR